jgi:archaellum component FlaF (FlaF/FlaG flagellin family)
MKTKILFIATLISTGLLASSCANDFLEQKNTSSLNQNTFFDSDNAVSEATSTLYNYVWSSFNGKLYYSMGDGRSNNITAQWSNYIKVYTNFNETSLSEGLQEGWASLYSVVAQSNNVINNIKEKCSSDVSESAKTEGMAEARFMRGVAYWYLASLWGNVIIYENTSDLVNNYVVPTNPRADVMEFAIRDLEYAAKYLPAVSSATGRVNRYSAYGMLSRLYLSMAGLTTDGQYNGTNVATDFNRATRNTYYLNLARKAAEKVVNGSSFKLMDSYASLFKIANNNCAEDMFQLQWIAGSTDAIGWGCNQDISAFFGWSTMVSDGTNWGGATCCSWDLFQEYESGDLRKHESVAAYGDHYADINVKGGGYTYGVTENASTNGANIKKYVVGTHDDNGVSYKQSSGINTHMLRLAEVYLNLAEAILGNDASTTDAEALKYFNAVRTRAGLEAKTSISYKDLKHERRMEFAFEGLYWYDLVNRAYYKQQEVVNYLNNQDRNRTYKYDADKAKYVASENAGTGVATATASSMLLPYSDADQNKNSYLKSSATPVAYTFGDREVDETTLFQ